METNCNEKGQNDNNNTVIKNNNDGLNCNQNRFKQYDASRSKEVKDFFADIFIGTAGYNYSHWRDSIFYPRGIQQRKELHYFSGIFPSVEINNTFHGIPREQTFQSWKMESKKGFKFALKAPKEITHDYKLNGDHSSSSKLMTSFLDKATILGPTVDDENNHKKLDNNDDKLGPILFQLPPSCYKDISKIEWVARFLLENKKYDKIKVAFEFRNKSWYCDEVYDILRQFNFAICENISPDNGALRSNTETASWCYTRFHKNIDRGVTNYSDEQLEQEADFIFKRSIAQKKQFIYFLNDHEGNSTRNAQTLMQILLSKKRKHVNVQSTFLVQPDIWRPQHVVEKGGKGSIQFMFANVMKQKRKHCEDQVEKDNPKKQKTDQLLPNFHNNEESGKQFEKKTSQTSIGMYVSKPAVKKSKSPTHPTKKKKLTIDSFFTKKIKK